MKKLFKITAHILIAVVVWLAFFAFVNVLHKCTWGHYFIEDFYTHKSEGDSNER
jgi:hypothetical protein